MIRQPEAIPAMPHIKAAVLMIAVVAVSGPAAAQVPQVPALPPAVEAEIPVPVPPTAEEPPPGFQPLQPAEEAAPAPLVAPLVAPVPSADPAPAPAVELAPPAAVAEPVQPVAAPAASAPAAFHEAFALPTAQLPAWATATVLLLGAFLAGLFGVMTAMLLRRGEVRTRTRAAAATLATELETRRQAFEAVPLPPNVEAGVFFVSAVTSLAGIDAGFRAAQTDLHLLPGKLAAHVSVHYAAVQRVADFVKGQSLAAAVRMLQANRLGGYPCPDAGTMRDAHEELTAAFRGTEKLAASLREIAG